MKQNYEYLIWNIDTIGILYYLLENDNCIKIMKQLNIIIIVLQSSLNYLANWLNLKSL